jgi:hypothetical protein
MGKEAGLVDTYNESPSNKEDCHALGCWVFPLRLIFSSGSAVSIFTPPPPCQAASIALSCRANTLVPCC